MSALAAFAIVATTTLAQAQPPSVGYVYPPVLAPGAKTEVMLGGYDFTPDIEFRMPDTSIGLEKLGPLGEFHMLPPPYWVGQRAFIKAAPLPREFPARLDIPAGVAPGWIAWQAGNATGTSATRRFLVSALPIVLESRWRDDGQNLETLPVIVAARLSRNAEVDRYTFTAPAAVPVNLRLFARRLGSDVNLTVKVTDDREQAIVDVADTAGLDIDATFLAAAETPYTIHISDIDFRGHHTYLYALELTAGPRVVEILPAAGRRGASQDVTFVGYGLEGEKSGLGSVTRRVDFPNDGLRRFFDYNLETPFGSTAITLPLSDLVEGVASEPEASEGSVEPASQRLVVPGAVTARIDARNDEDGYLFRAGKGELFRIAVHAQALGSPIDAVLRVLDAEGKEVGKSDDVAGTMDCRLNFSAPADGEYTVIVADQSGTTLDALYRLVIERPLPDFTLSTGQTVNLAVGGTVELAVQAQRSGGHKDAIDLAVAGLPEGVTAASATIPGKGSEVKIKLMAAEDCATQLAYLKIMGASRVGDQTVSRVAHARLSGSLCPVDATLETTTRILLATTLQSPVTIAIVDRNRQRAVPRGTTYPLPVSITRANGYDGEISLLMAAQQGRRRHGIWSPITKVPSGAEQVGFPVFLPEWLGVERTSRMVVLAMAKVPDAKGNERYLMTKSASRAAFILEGALFKLTHASGEVEAQLGSAIDLVTSAKRVRQFREPVKVEVFFPEDVREKFKTAVVDLPADRENVESRIEIPTDQSLIGEHDVIVRATAIQNGNLRVVSQTTVTLVIVP